MEVYTAVFSASGQRLTETAPVIVDGSTFADRLAEGPVLFIGDGALKCREVILGTAVANESQALLRAPDGNRDGALFIGCCPRADAMLRPAMAALKEERFEDTAYFEPFYLKQFVATVSAKKLF